MAQRRKRRSKAEIEAEKKAKEIQAAEEAAKKAEGYEKVRARDDEGHFIKDDPSTPENEAWDWKKPEEPAKPEVKAEPAEPAVKAEPAKPVKQSTFDETTHSDIPLYGSARFRAKKEVKKGTR